MDKQPKKAIIRLPKTFTIRSLYSIIKVRKKTLSIGAQQVIIDFSDLNLIEVGGITALSNLIEYFTKIHIKIICIGLNICGARQYLEDSGFTKQYGRNRTNEAENDEFLPLRLVEYERSPFYISEVLIPWLASALEVDSRSLISIKVCFDEIFNNIRDHSTENVGCSCAHRDKENGKILICIADYGVGIAHRVRSQMQIGSDHAAIAMACQEGFSTKTTPRNMGAGLHVLIRNVVGRNSGIVRIYSGNGIYRCFPSETDSTGIKKHGAEARKDDAYPGTVIYIELDCSKFIPSEFDEEVFEWED